MTTHRLANLSGFPLDAFGTIMSYDHQIPPINLRGIHTGSGGARPGGPQGGR